MAKTFLPALRATLIDYRQRAEVAQIKVADVADVHPSNISRFERGEAGWPDDMDVYVNAYADACDIKPADIWTAALARYKRARTPA